MENDLKKIERLLTPKFNRGCPSHIYAATPRKSSKLWRNFAGIAAMAAIIITVGLATIHTPEINAEEVVKTSLQDFVGADTYKASFHISAIPSGDDEIYKIDPDGKRVDGVMYIKYTGDKPMVRFEWKDNDNTTVIYSGSEYLCYKNGRLTARHSATPILDLKAVTKLSTAESLAERGGDCNKSITVNGDIITLSSAHKGIVLTADFSADSKRMVKAGATLNGVTIMETDTIEYGIDIPSDYFD